MDRIDWKCFIRQKKTIILLVAELALLLCGVIGLLQPVQRTVVEPGQQNIHLMPGIYSVRMGYYAASEGHSMEITDQGSGSYGILFNGVGLHSGENAEEYELWVLGTENSLQVQVSGTEESGLTVSYLEIVSTNKGSRIFLFLTLLCSVLLDSVTALRYYDKKYGISMKKKAVWAVLGMTILLLSVPSMTDYNIWGHDWGFHLLRVEGLISGLKDGQFPVRIQGNWLKGYGYAASIFYSDLFMLIPAFFRMLGFTVRTSNNLFIIVINAATVLAAYRSLKHSFREERIAAAGAVLYAAASYRVYDVYMRAAMGEILAMIFLPVVFSGFYGALTEDIHRKEYRKNMWLLTAGLTGIIHSHVLTCEMLAFSVVILCLVCWKRVFRRETFWLFVQTVVLTVMINLWYLVPFLDYFVHEKFNVSYKETMHFQTIQEWGTMPSHLLFGFYGRGARAVATNISMYESGSFGVGAALLLVLFVWIYAELSGRVKRFSRKDRAAGRLLFWFAILYFVLSSSYFPWDAIQNLGGAAEKLVLSLQFPYRFLGFACLTLAVLACVLARGLQKTREAKLSRVFLLLGVGISCIFLCYQTNQILMHRGIVRVYEKQGMGTMEIGNGEYLPFRTEVSLLQANMVVPGEGVTVEHYEKGADTLQTRLYVINQGEESYVEVPLLYYRGYRASDEITGERLDVICGDNNVVRVVLPEGYEGGIRIAFHSPWYWRAAEILSLLTVIGLLAVTVTGKRIRRRTENPTGELAGDLKAEATETPAEELAGDLKAEATEAPAEELAGDLKAEATEAPAEGLAGDLKAEATEITAEGLTGASIEEQKEIIDINGGREDT